MQTTIKSAVRFTGVGLHSGAPAKMVVYPASAEHGIWFKRTDIRVGDALIPARWDAVNQTPLCTRIENARGASVSTIEHIMAALVGCGLHNALIEIDGPEVPIMDGSAAEFVRAILARGIVQLDAPVRAIEVLMPIEVRRGDAVARLEPGEGLSISFGIDFEDAAIGHQEKTLNMANGAFVRELCDSRTFCRQADVDAMRAQGLALGGTMENAVVVDGDTVLSPGGLRHEDEAVRHKMLDALGDLALAGAPIIGAYHGERAGHALTNDLLHALFNTPGAFRMVTCDRSMAKRLPGVGVQIAEIPEVA
ncbi:UDP-3-O-acyl-N-acetylglucosamine deacetylase [Rhodalgimonas zhirmunskyi]|uniref:UDP-3-O-acyl-N-acetylglucosamine deacetylase n=1 Tax=Rhodalgimonas zhirmunskyi TaxID=2964767 RepID=A0AAJ1X5P2_9RHOB|nr:UDP-3-O-acyl-N-acetylglucosamine deacetylase [Rhodoalgimonas zhirmunskyi]MDQ2095453.1 UDP-3-O-acyl-N-acetylglucosamine deacetylase [Rhodoalgimonas zhirmunskyi]